MEWVTAEQDFYLKSTNISYLDPEIILEFAKVKLISLESKRWVWINPLCLFALSPIITNLKKNDDDGNEDFEIVTEHSVEDLQHIVNFCHSGIFPPESKGLDNVFHDFGINVSTYSNPINNIPTIDKEEEEIYDTKEGILDSFVDTEIKEYDDEDFEYESPTPPPSKRQKKGKVKPKAKDWTYEQPLENCKGCGKDYRINVIRNHLAQKSVCKEAYSPEALTELEKQCDDHRKMKKKEQNRKYEIERQIEKRKAEMEEDDEEWDPELLDNIKEEVEDFSDENNDESLKYPVPKDISRNFKGANRRREKCGRHKKDSSDLIAAEKRSHKKPLPELSKLTPKYLAMLHRWQLPEPIEHYHQQACIDRKVGKTKCVKKEQKNSCHLCPRKFTSDYILRQHILINHSEHYRCSHCSKAYSCDDPKGFKFHMFKHDYDGPLVCIQCGFTCYDRSVFVHHTTKKLYVHDNLCTQCNEPMETFEAYQFHVAEKHNGKMMYKCKQCPDLFEDLEVLDKHRRIYHCKKPAKKLIVKRPKKLPRVVTCEVCGISTRYLTSHTKFYHDKDEILCKDCGKICQNPYKLKAHQYQSHSDVACPECGEVMSKKKLPKHIQSRHVPNSERKYKCEICGKGFTSKRALEEHINIHTGAKPYECKFCGARYANSGNRDAHIRTVHHGIKRSK